MKKTIYRLQQPTPPFFRRMQKRCFRCLVVVSLIMIAPVSLPSWFVSLAWHSITGFISIMFVAQMAVDIDRIFLDWIYGERINFPPSFYQQKLLN